MATSLSGFLTSERAIRLSMWIMPIMKILAMVARQDVRNVLAVVFLLHTSSGHRPLIAYREPFLSLNLKELRASVESIASSSRRRPGLIAIARVLLSLSDMIMLYFKMRWRSCKQDVGMHEVCYSF